MFKLRLTYVLLFTYVLTYVNLIFYLCLTYASMRPINSTCMVFISNRTHNPLDNSLRVNPSRLVHEENMTYLCRLSWLSLTPFGRQVLEALTPFQRQVLKALLLFQYQVLQTFKTFFLI